MYQDLSTCHDWPVKKAIVNLPIRLKGNSEHIYGNSLSRLRAQNKDIGAALQMLLLNYICNAGYLVLGRFPFVRTDRPDHSRRSDNFSFNQNSPARSVKS